MKTMYRAFSIVTLAVMLMTLGFPYVAQAAENDLANAPAGQRLPRFVDDKGLLTQAQGLELTAKLDEISERHQFDAVVAVVHSIKSGFNIGSQEVRLYAADFFEQNGFGIGRDLDGIILLLATERRDFGIATTGFGLKAFTDAGQEYLEKQFLPHLKTEDYFKAFMVYADAVDDFLIKAKAGKPYTSDNIPLTAEELTEHRIWSSIVSLAIGLIIAFIITFRWKSRLKTVREENFANAYVRDGSMVVTVQQDIFQYRNVIKKMRVKKEISSGGGSFKSSSGRSFSGRSGKY